MNERLQETMKEIQARKEYHRERMAYHQRKADRYIKWAIVFACISALAYLVAFVTAVVAALT